MAKLKFKPYSIKGTHKEKMTADEKKNFDWGEWNRQKLDKGSFTNPVAKKMAERQRLEYALAKSHGNLTKLKKLDAKIESVNKHQAKIDSENIRDDAQKEINKKTKLENYFETGEYKGKERHEGKGRWVTMKGRRVFIEDGQNPTDALNKSLAWEKKNKRRSGVGNKDWNK